MSMNKQGRPTQPGSAGATPVDTFSGHRGLDHEEPLIFERGGSDRCGVDLPEPKHVAPRLGGLERKAALLQLEGALPSEPEKRATQPEHAHAKAQPTGRAKAPAKAAA